jgi:hypothetical protein
MEQMQQTPSQEVQLHLKAEFAHAVSLLGLTGEESRPVWGWEGRSLSGPVRTSAGKPCWLHLRWRSAYDDEPRQWTQVAHAELAVHGLPINRPQFLNAERFTRLGRRYQAELYTRAPLPALTSSRAAPADAHTLPPGWWTQLREALDTLRQAPARGLRPIDWCAKAARATADSDSGQWIPAHGDFCWANLANHAGTPWIFDWDTFDLAPPYTDAATLLICSLDRPDVATRVRETFADQLDSPAGHYAQRMLGAHWLTRTTAGEHVDLEPALHAHLRRLNT